MARPKPRTRTTTTVVEADPAEETGTEIDPTGLEAAAEGEIDAIDELRALGGDDGVKWTVKKVPVKPGERGGDGPTYSSGGLSIGRNPEAFVGGKYNIRGPHPPGLS